MRDPSREPSEGLIPVRGDVTGPSRGPMSRARPELRAGWREKGESGGVEAAMGGVTGAARGWCGRGEKFRQISAQVLAQKRLQRFAREDRRMRCSLNTQAVCRVAPKLDVSLDPS